MYMYLIVIHATTFDALQTFLFVEKLTMNHSVSSIWLSHKNSPSTHSTCGKTKPNMKLYHPPSH